MARSHRRLRRGDPGAGSRRRGRSLTRLPATLDGVSYQVRHSARAKRLQAVVRSGRVEVVVPRWARPRHVGAFVRQAAPWIAKKAAAVRERSGSILPERCVSGAPVRYEGRTLDLRVVAVTESESSVALGEEIVVRLAAAAEGDAEMRARAILQEWLMAQARAVAQAHVETYASRLGRGPRGLRIKAQKTLWGSCGRTGIINLNWRLIGAPLAVFEYIVVHELCHLAERNHGPRFWSLVARLMPDYAPHRAWLREHGMKLG